MNERFVLFDFDGVIFDSASAKTQAFINVYKNEGTPEQLLKIEQYHNENFGINRINKFKYYEKVIFNRNYTDQSIQNLCNKFKELLEKSLLKKSIFPGVKEFLDQIKNANIKMYIVSGAPKEEILEVLNKQNISHYFIDIFDGLNSKETHIKNIMHHHKAKSHQFVFLGDGMTDLNAAQQSDIKFIAVNPNFDKNDYEILRVNTLDELNHNFYKFLSVSFD